MRRIFSNLLESSVLRCATHWQTKDWLLNSASHLDAFLSTWILLRWGHHLLSYHRRKQSARARAQKFASWGAGENSWKGRKPPSLPVFLKWTSHEQKPHKVTLWKMTPKIPTPRVSDYDLINPSLQCGVAHPQFPVLTVLLNLTQSLNAWTAANPFCWTINVITITMWTRMIILTLKRKLMKLMTSTKKFCFGEQSKNVTALCIPLWTMAIHQKLKNPEIKNTQKIAILQNLKKAKLNWWILMNQAWPGSMIAAWQMSHSICLLFGRHLNENKWKWMKLLDHLLVACNKESFCKVFHAETEHR